MSEWATAHNIVIGARGPRLAVLAHEDARAMIPEFRTDRRAVGYANLRKGKGAAPDPTTRAGAEKRIDLEFDKMRKSCYVIGKLSAWVAVDDENSAHPQPGGHVPHMVVAFIFASNGGGYKGTGGNGVDVDENFMTASTTRDFMAAASGAHKGLLPAPPPSAVLYTGSRAAEDAARANAELVLKRRRISAAGENTAGPLMPIHNN